MTVTLYGQGEVRLLIRWAQSSQESLNVDEEGKRVNVTMSLALLALKMEAAMSQECAASRNWEGKEMNSPQNL